jgi:uncharacterized membrane protein
MVAYHGAWFATEAGLFDLPIRSDLRWVAFQKCIAGAFFGLVGVSLQLSAPLRPAPFLRRIGRVGGCAGVVTVTSIVLDPDRVVTFGILHAIACCSILALPLLRLPSIALLLGAAVLVFLGLEVRLEALDHPALYWTGLAPRVPRTFDHQPFLPWFGVVVGGLVLGRWLRRLPDGGPACQSAGPRFLGLLGRHSLFLYMAHVPVLISIVGLLAWLA